MKDEKYIEFKVTEFAWEKGEFIVKAKEPTKRGFVMISARDAEVNNAQTQFTKLFYEKPKEPKKEKTEK
jgi:hypothetical protein